MAKKKFLKFYVKFNCGCCTAELRFLTEERFKAAFEALGLTSSGEIRDDSNRVHKKLDTFYGWSANEVETKNRSLGFLLDKAVGVKE